ncbi:Pyruvate/Phosphoenolpyruvate kinase-like domain-containing protein [Pavlovales sp. CCMP2436]|nr:Pyruvate/Phosphoenolpyruvate kinase-like domain-containing protein [Pavlovales sp. CCMP2436]
MALLKARNALQSGRTLVGHWAGCGNPLMAETVSATCDYDVFVVDCQHGILDASDAMAVLASVRNATPFIRLRDVSPSHIHHSLDAGALGLIAPLINSAEDARAFVEESMYPPLGRRSFGPARASLLSPNYFQEANGLVMCWAMIETAAALKNVKEIAAVEGIDGLFIGPNDLSLSLGVGPSSSPNDPRVIASARIPPLQ